MFRVPRPLLSSGAVLLLILGFVGASQAAEHFKFIVKFNSRPL
ncbi:MAG: hypothetical protein ABW034_07050 [Steroidobacteraceae bacterium]